MRNDENELVQLIRTDAGASSASGSHSTSGTSTRTCATGSATSAALSSQTDSICGCSSARCWTSRLLTPPTDGCRRMRNAGRRGSSLNSSFCLLSPGLGNETHLRASQSLSSLTEVYETTPPPPQCRNCRATDAIHLGDLARPTTGDIGPDAAVADTVDTLSFQVLDASDATGASGAAAVDYQPEQVH